MNIVDLQLCISPIEHPLLIVNRQAIWCFQTVVDDWGPKVPT